jgi:SAM-dependent methyltransferase
MVNSEAHWESIYRSKAPDSVSWYRPHLELSLDLIERYAPERSAAVIDVGGGEATLVDDLVLRGYQNVAVLDISQTAIEATRRRLGASADAVRWIPGDVTKVELPVRSLDVWHDRAVFHFLTELADREAYVRSVLHAVRPGGHVIVSAFGPDGPVKCSGLDVIRYDADSLHREFGRRFRIEESTRELHSTPWGSQQQFVYCCCHVE